MKNVLFSFIRCPEARLAEVDNGKAPRESLLGYHYLRSHEFPVRHLVHSNRSDRGLIAAVRENIRHLLWAEIVVIATNMRLIAALLFRILGKRVIFYDAFQRLPKHPLKKLYVRLCIALSHRCIFYSANQLTIWKASYPALEQKGRSITYGVDSNYFSTDDASIERPTRERSYYLSIGRDPSRDFTTLANAFVETDRSLVLVTQEYLLNDALKQGSNISIRSGLSYQALSEVYDNAKASVIPIVKGTSHLSGIRAAMEAMAKYVPVIISRNDSLSEYFDNGNHVLFFEPENVESLTVALRQLEQSDASSEMTLNAQSLVSTQYTYQRMAEELLDAIDAHDN